MADYKIEVEFPDYPVDSLPGDIPEWLECVPWHNDACPIWYMRGYEDPEAGIHLAIDYPDVWARICPTSAEDSAATRCNAAAGFQAPASKQGSKSK